MIKKALLSGILIAFISITPAPAFAVGSGGFENASFSAKSLGMGDAVTATPDEPAAISYNPAGIADLPGIQIQGDANFISMFTWKHNDITGDTRSSGTLSTVPTAYLTINPGKIFCDKLALGIGMDSPFGLMNKYRSSNAATHYTGWKNWLKMYTIKPTVAYKITDKISVGGGPMWYRISDFGAIQGYPNNLVTLPPFPFGAGTNTPDGQIRANMSGNHWGWQMGTLIKLSEKHRLGYYFRSPVVVKVSGLAKVENANCAAAGGLGNHNFETGIHTKVALPMNMTWAYAYQPTPKTHYEVDFTWSHWSTHKNLRLNTGPTGSTFDDGILGGLGQTASNDKDWKDGYGIQIGASHKLTDKLTLRGGSFLYFTPIPQKHFSPAVPDSNHLAICMGLGYALTKNLTADLSYYNAFYFSRRINNDVGEDPRLLNSSVDGRYTTYMQAFTVSLTAHWDDLFPRLGAKETPSIEIKPAA